MEEESVLVSGNRSDDKYIEITEKLFWLRTSGAVDVYQAEKKEQLYTILTIILAVFAACCLILVIYMIIFPPRSAPPPSTLVIPVIRRSSHDQQVSQRKYLQSRKKIPIVSGQRVV